MIESMKPGGSTATVDLALDNVPERRLRELDGWRAVSVLLVIVHHIAYYQHGRPLSRVPSLSHMVLYFGPLGVKIFFVISGFVICRLLLLEESGFGSISLKAFYCRRVFRILPPFYIYLTAVTLLFCFGLIHQTRKEIVSAALFLYDIHSGPQSWHVGHTWSLAVEEQFYLLFPTTLVLLPRRWRRFAFLGVFFLCAAWAASMVYTGQNSRVSFNVRAGFTCIACGVLMALHERHLRPLAKAVPALVVALVGLTLLVHPLASDTYTWWVALYETLFVPPAIGLVLLFSLERAPSLRAVLCSGPVQAVGLTSYGIYLWQQLFTAPKQYFSGPGEMIPMLLPMLCLVVPLSYFLVEKPAIAYGKSLSRQLRKIPIDRASRS
jgi:peptidoglycan/LPS O-acetylase OafA/YrhL